VASIPPHGGRKHAQQEYIQVNTRNILFICGGAFSDLDKVIRARSDQSGIGFSASVKSKKDKQAISALLKQVEPEDLIKFGLIPEFVGRLPVVATLEELTKDDLVRILIEPKNALIKQYKKLFEMENVEIEFVGAALKAVAEKALERKAGARGLRSILETVLLDTMYDLPSLTDVSKIVIDDNVINGKKPPVLVYEKSGRGRKTG